MIAALVELGHREIAFLAGPSTLFVARARLAGYRRGLEVAGIAFDERLVIHTSFDREGGALGVDTLLGGAAPFTAIACANDPLAMGALARLAELGIDVPGQLSVAGFDDVPVAAITSPSLSTVRLPLREMGRRGFAEAARVLNGEPLERTVCRPSSRCVRRPGLLRPCRSSPRGAAKGGAAKRGSALERAARGARRADHGQQPGDRCRSRGQGGRRGRHDRGPLRDVPRWRRADARARSRGGGRRELFGADIGDGHGSGAARRRCRGALRAHRWSREQRRDGPASVRSWSYRRRSGTT